MLDNPGLRKSGTGGARGARRVLALVLPELLVELARQSSARPQSPIAVVLNAELAEAKARTKTSGVGSRQATERLAAVDSAAQRLGLYRGQSVRAAAHRVPELDIVPLGVARVASALAGLVDVLRSFGHGYSCAFPDTLWLDVTHSAASHGDERTLGLELVGKLAKLGHYCRAAFANGPLLAQAFARHADMDGTGVLVVPSGGVEHALGQLPVLALPMTPEHNVRSARAGILTLAELREHASFAQLPAGFRRLLQGQDDTPLQELAADDKPYEELLGGAASSVDGALAAACRRLGARLEGLGKAAEQLSLVLGLSFMRAGATVSEHVIDVRLPVPSARAHELERAVQRKLPKLDSAHRLCLLRLKVERMVIDEAVQQRLPLELASAPAAAPASVVMRVAEELASRLGPGSVGRFARAKNGAQVSGKHPHARGERLVELPAERTFAGLTRSALPNRILPVPIEMHGRVERGQLVFLGSDVFMIAEGRIESEHSSTRPQQEYLRLWLVALRALNPGAGHKLNAASAAHGVEVLARHDQSSRRVFVEGYFD